MARKYAHIKQHEEEIKKMHEDGASYREIGQTLGFSREQIKECMRRPRRLLQSSLKLYHNDGGARRSTRRQHGEQWQRKIHAYIWLPEGANMDRA